MAKKKQTAPSLPVSPTLVTLGKAASAEMTERKSVFIGSASPVKSEEEAVEFVKAIRAKYPDATHNVYAYTIGANVTRFSDDGEPSGTAGMPVLDVIRKSGFTDAVIVVTRYFGGILLGAGGLVRAYSASAKLACDAAGIVTYEQFTDFTLTAGYSDYQRLERLIDSECRRVSADFKADVKLTLTMKKSGFDSFAEKCSELTAARASLTVTGEHFDK